MTLLNTNLPPLILTITTHYFLFISYPNTLWYYRPNRNIHQSWILVQHFSSQTLYGPIYPDQLLVHESTNIISLIYLPYGTFMGCSSLKGIQKAFDAFYPDQSLIHKCTNIDNYLSSTWDTYGLSLV